ncbi:hypothetical protein QBC43DRAFT_335255 [Cladorrhinum sp. PSN259]|nr:hypothetical protein QBC43DRAFT_335255 [Cladorrhinum sp. PSN259]
MSWMCCNCRVQNPDGNHCSGQVPGQGQIQYLVACGHTRCLSCTERRYESQAPHSSSSESRHYRHKPTHHMPANDHYQEHQYHATPYSAHHFSPSSSSFPPSHQPPQPSNNHTPSALSTYLSAQRLSPTVMTIGEYDTLTKPPPQYIPPLGYMEDYLSPMQNINLDPVGSHGSSTKPEQDCEKVDILLQRAAVGNEKKKRNGRRKKSKGISSSSSSSSSSQVGEKGKERMSAGEEREKKKMMISSSGHGLSAREGREEKNKKRKRGGCYQPTVEDMPEDEEEEW